MTQPLQSFLRSTAHQRFIAALACKRHLLVIQDLDGVCMGLVRAPNLRTMAPDYIHAVKDLEDQFFVLRNGEHTGVCVVRGHVAIGSRVVCPRLYAEHRNAKVPARGFETILASLRYPGSISPDILCLHCIKLIDWWYKSASLHMKIYIYIFSYMHNNALL